MGLKRMQIINFHDEELQCTGIENQIQTSVLVFGRVRKAWAVQFWKVG